MSENPERTVLVDDIPSNLERLTKMFQEKGNVYTANTLDTAKSVIEEVQPTRIITDLDLAEANGGRLRHIADGYLLVKWVYDKQQEGELPEAQEVILHSTFFNKYDKFGRSISSVRRWLMRRTYEMGYTAQGKKILLP